MHKVKILILILLCLSLSTIQVYANGTAAGSIVTNAVSISYSNSAGTTYGTNISITDTVLEIYGLAASVTSVTNATTGPGGDVDFFGKVTNMGNTSQLIFFTNFQMLYGGGASDWRYDFLNDALSSVSTMTLAAYNARGFYIRVHVTNAAAYGHSATNDYGTYQTNFGRFTRVSNYTGLNGTGYGGRWYTDARRSVLVVSDVPDITIAKYAFVTNSASYVSLGGGAYDLVPGSLITYAVTFTNSGTVSAYGLTISDPIPADAQYSNNSMKYREGLRTFASNQYYNNAACSNLTDAGSDEAVGVYDCDGNSNGGAGPVEFTFSQPVPAGGKGTVYFRVTVR